MTIRFITTTAAGTSSPNPPATFQFVATNAAGQPLASTAFTATQILGTMAPLAPGGTTDAQGQGTINFAAIPPNGAYSRIRVVAGTLTADQTVGLFDENAFRTVTVMNAEQLDINSWRMTPESLRSSGLQVRANLVNAANQGDAMFLSAGPAFTEILAQGNTGSATFSIGAGDPRLSGLVPGRYELFWGLETVAGNVYAPLPGELVIWDPTAESLLPVELPNVSSNYINIVADINGVQFRIPTQPNVAVNDAYTLRFSTTSATGGWRPIASGTLDALPFTFTTEPYFFATQNIPDDTLTWFSYTVTNGGVTRESAPVTRIVSVI